MKIKYVDRLEGTRVVPFAMKANLALIREGQWDPTSVLVSSDLECVYAVEGRRIVGCLTFHINETEAIINIAYVHPDFRGQGVYRQMHDKFVEVARERGAAYILNICYPSNTGIQETCKKLGYEPYVVHLKLRLKDHGDPSDLDE